MNGISQSDSTYTSVQAMTQNAIASSTNSKKINLTQARKILGVSPNKMSKLVNDGTLAHELDPLDQRVKLVLLKDVERLKRVSDKD